MRKRIIWMLCLCFCILGLTACGEDPKTIDYNGQSYEALEAYATETWEAIQDWDIPQMQEAVAQIDDMAEAQRISVMEANEGLEEQYTLTKSWLDIQDEIGTYVGVDSFQVTKSGKSTTTELTISFEKRPVILSCVYNNRNMEVENVTLDLVYTTGEKMQKAALNTLMGMGTVFVMLILISLIIYCFAIIPKIEKKIQERKARKNGTDQGPLAEAEASQDFTTQPDDYELVAVIAAAIAAETGQSTDDFVVRSIRRR